MSSQALYASGKPIKYPEELSLTVSDFGDMWIAMARQDHPLSLKGTRKAFWIHCPHCSYTGRKCDFGKDDGLTGHGALEAAYEHVQREHPLMQILTVEMQQTPFQPIKLTTKDKRSLR